MGGVLVDRPHAKMISVVIIGKNASPYLRKLYSQTSFPESWDVIYVDSNSADGSLDLAASYGWRTIWISSSTFWTPALGRKIGAISARGKWILFLDCDMVLPQVACLSAAVSELDAAAHASPFAAIGLTGRQTDVAPNGKRREQSVRSNAREEARFFGGNVLLRRDQLLAAGNWNENLAANEEIELYARLLRDGGRVLFDPVMACDHYGVSTIGRVRVLVSLYFPLTAKNRQRYGAYGVVLRESLRAGSFPQLMRLAPEPLLTLLAAGAMGACWLAGLPLMAPFMILAWAALILRRRSFAYLAVCPALAIQMVVGLFRFNRAVATWAETDAAIRASSGMNRDRHADANHGSRRA
jgi:hypothetical protein